MGQRSVTRQVGPASMRAQFEPATIDEKKRTVDLTWTTGARVLRGYYDPYYEELSLEPKHVRMERLQSGAAPLLNTHGSYDISDVLGVVENARLEKGKGTATVRFDSGPQGEDAFRRVREGTLRNISVGYTTHKMQKVEDGAATVPVYRAVDWEPHELSLVPIGADAGAVTRSGGGMTNPCEFIQEREMPDPVVPAPTTIPAPASQPTPAPAAPPAVTAAQRAEIELAERTRSEGIRRVGVVLKRSEADITKAINEGTSLEAFRAASVDALANAPTEQGGVLQLGRASTGAMIRAGEDARDKFKRGAEAAIMERAGVLSLVRAASKLPEWEQIMRIRGLSVEVDADPGEFRGLRMLDIARRSLDIIGARSSGMLAMDVVAAAFEIRAASLGGLGTTSDFPNILENVLYKTLLAQYMITPDTWTRFCKTGSVQDFRASKRYRMGTFGSLAALNEAGEFQSASIPDAEKQSITAATKGRIIGISRQAIINDDMGAFSSLATMLGRAAKLSVEVDVYAALTSNSGLGPTMSDGNTLFHASHNNITTGAAIGSAAIDADRVAMASQKDPSGNELLALTPAVLVLPIGLGGVARQINNGQYDFDSTKFQTPNRVGGLFRDIVDTARITGTRRYLFADPGVAPTFEVAFLDGQQQPFMDVQPGWRVDGFEWKVRLDYGVAPIDFRGAITNAGA